MTVVTIGGVEAKVVRSDGKSLYCIVMGKSYEGTVEIKIFDREGEFVTDARAAKKFDYVRKMIVSTFLGEVDERGNYVIKDGPFDDCGGFRGISWLSFDPKNHDHLYYVDDGGRCQLINFEARNLSTLYTNGQNYLDRMRNIQWTVGGDTMLIAADRGSNNDHPVILMTRGATAGPFKDARQFLPRGSMQCNGSAVHPVNGELYFNSYNLGQFYRYAWGEDNFYELFRIKDQAWEYNIQIHPSGNLPIL
jgi:hypothetical protein